MGLVFVLFGLPFGFCCCFVKAVTLGKRDSAAWQRYLKRVQMSVLSGPNSVPGKVVRTQGQGGKQRMYKDVHINIVATKHEPT